jgi:hypothetical protein
MSLTTKLWLVLVTLMLPFASTAQFLFTTNNGTITITGYSGTDNDVMIPGTIYGYPVITIGNSAFFNSTLTNVTLPETVTKIDVQAFTGSHLSSIITPDSVITIGQSAFLNCSSLASITIGTNMTTVGGDAFGNCPSLTNIFIPQGVTNFVYNTAFAECTNLIAIDVDPRNPSFSSAGGILFDKNQTTLVTFPSGLSGNFTVPNTVASISDKAFEWCINLTNVNLPSGLINIGQSAFISCGRITNITIPNGVLNISADAFSGTRLTNVLIPATVTNIGPAAFACTTLASITVDANNPAYNSVGGVLFATQPNTLVQFPIAKSGTVFKYGNYAVPQGVVAIGDNAFEGCFLGSITLPTGLTSIGNFAFDRCKITSIVLPTGITNIGDVAFDSTGLTNLLVPATVRHFGWLGSLAFLQSLYFEGDAPTVGGIPYLSNPSHIITAYHFAGTTGWGPYFQNIFIPTAEWSPPQLDTTAPNFGITNNTFGFNINWAVGTTVIIETCDNLATHDWQPLSTNTLGTSSTSFSDNQPVISPTRFYRIRTP